MRRAWLMLAGTVLAGAALAQGWQSGPTTGYRFTRFDGEYFPGTNKVYFLGGRLSAGTTDGSVWSFDPVAGTYADVGVDMPAPVSNYDICLLRDDYNLPLGDTFGLYIVGGRLASGANTDAVQVYYPTSNTTRTVSTDPFPGRISGQITVAAGCGTLGNKAYVAGGFLTTVASGTREAWMFDPLAAAGSRWTRLRDMNVGRGYTMVAAVDSFVYTVGGDTFNGTNLYARRYCERLNARDTAAGWTRMADLPKPNGEARVYGFDSDSPYGFAGRVIVGGLGAWPNESTYCFIYTAATNTWDTFPRLMQARRNHAGAFIPGSRGTNGVPGIWVWGGRQVNDTMVLRTAEYYQMQMTGVAEPAVGRNAGFVAAPNPSRGAASVRSAKQEPAVLRVYDVLGKAVLSLRSDNGRFELRGLGAGTYVLRLETPARIEERKLVVAR